MKEKIVFKMGKFRAKKQKKKEKKRKNEQNEYRRNGAHVFQMKENRILPTIAFKYICLFSVVHSYSTKISGAHSIVAHNPFTK